MSEMTVESIKGYYESLSDAFEKLNMMDILVLMQVCHTENF